MYSQLKKKPKNPNSQEIVDTVLKTVEEIMSQASVNQVNTNKVAEMAGISVGSLYHYFSSKENIINTLTEHLLEKNIAEFKNGFSKLKGAGFEAKLKWCLDTFYVRYIKKKSVFEQIFIHATRSIISDKMIVSRARILTIVLDSLKEDSPELVTPEFEEKLFFFINVYADSIHTSVQTQSLNNAKIDWNPQKAQKCLFEVANKLFDVNIRPD